MEERIEKNQKVSRIIVEKEDGTTEVVEHAILISTEKLDEDTSKLSIRLADVNFLDIAQMMIEADKKLRKVCMEGLLNHMASKKES